MTARYSGSCLCGAVSFEFDGEFERFFLCHCQRCRKGSGTAHAANLFLSPERFEWLAGADEVKAYRVPESRRVSCFCSICGSPVPTLNEEHGIVKVPAGCLDSPVPKRPDAHIFMASKADWDFDLADVPMLDELPD
ncbi:GFA family protein [Microbaculum marinum]|uniref:GFA family protein n=1 Tax=Microbaculum marinum TaxID=1764581 RepID=A0AAW9S0L1_9HYPH